MDLELKHLSQTLAVGGFAVYATLFIVKICRAKWIPRFFDATDGKLQLQHAAVYLALVLAAGVVLEDVSKNYVARRASFFPDLFNRVLDADNELRLRSLFTVTHFSDSSITARPKGIFRELQKLPPRHKAVAPHIEEIQRHVPSPAPAAVEITTKEEVGSLLRAVDGVFYDAKNVVYRQDTYFHELSDISDRMDFTRSLTFLCLLFSIFNFLVFVCGCIPPAARFLDIDKAERTKLLVLCLLYGAGIWFVGTAYRSEVANYDLRVFGYYISLTLDHP